MKLRLFGSWALLFFWIFGILLLTQDLLSFLKQEQAQNERLARTIAHSFLSFHESETPQGQDRQSEVSSQLQERLLQIRSNLQIIGHLAIQLKTTGGDEFYASTDPKMVASGSYFFDNSRMYSITKGAASDGLNRAQITLVHDSTPFLVQALSLLLSYIIVIISSFLLLRAFVKPKTKASNHFQYFENRSDGLMKIDYSGKVISANDVFLEWIEAQFPEIEGLNLLSKSSPLRATCTDQRKDFDKIFQSHEAFRSRVQWNFKRKKPIISSAAFYPEDFGYSVVLLDLTHEIVKEAELSRNAASLKLENEFLQKQAMTDPLTGCFNRAYLSQILERKNLHWLAYDGSTLIMMDLDDFKRINDQFGHLEGDRILKEFAEILRVFFRKSDMIIRYGGDEFIVILNRVDLKTAQTVANNFLERNREAFQKLCSDGSFRVSIGMAELDHNETGENWLSRADRALYKAKNDGTHAIQADDLNQLEILN